MTLPRLKLRHQLLLLLVAVGLVGMTAFTLVIVFADHQLFSRFVPENRALRDVESRSALLIQDYYRFMLTPEIIGIDNLDGELLLIRQSLEKYQELIQGQSRKLQLAASIGAALDTLEQAGREMVVAQQRFEQIFEQQQILIEEIDIGFQRYQQEVSVDIRSSIAQREWDLLVKRYIPELRMIKSLNQQYLRLFLQTSEFHIEPSPDIVSRIDTLKRQIKMSGSMLELYEESSNERALLSASLLQIYQRLLKLVEMFTESRQQAKFAVSKAEQSGIDLKQAIGNAIGVTETEGWRDLREALFLSGSVLLLTLVVSYLLIYAGLDRFLRPLEKLQVVITRLGKGDFKQRTRDVTRTDEIGQLATSFNRMAEQLEQSDEQKQEFIDQLEQKNMELERFTYTVSHELKSPLVTVNGFLGLLQRDMAADNQESIDRDMAKIAGAIDTMSRQLDDLLELSRLGRAVNPPTRFSMTSLSHEVVQMMQGLIDECGAEVEIQDNMPHVHADHARIREVIKNLVENGIKFASAERYPRIEIAAESQGDEVLCRVRDNGPGIEPRYQEKVFGLFDRLATTVPGTGVGLALVKRIVEIHDGKIWIESQGDGQGCCFCFTLPIQRGS